MSRDANAAIKAAGIEVKKTDILKIRPRDLVLVTDPSSALYDPRVDDLPEEDFVLDIKERGIHTPVVVRQNGGTLEVVAGRHRVKAARLLEDSGIEIWVPCVKRHGSDLEMILLAASENAHKREESIHSRAVKAKKAMDLGATERDVCVAFKTSMPTLQTWLAYLDLSPEARKAVDSKEIPRASITQIAEVKREDQVGILEQLRQDGAKKTHEIRASIAAKKKGEKVELADTKKRLSRTQVEALIERLWKIEKGEEGDPEFAFEATIGRAFLRYSLGHERALDRVGGSTKLGLPKKENV